MISKLRRCLAEPETFDEIEALSRQVEIADLLALSDLLERAEPSVGYCQANDIDWAATQAFAGGLYLTRIEASGHRWFEWADDGEPAAFLYAMGQDGETLLDVVAWPLSDPQAVLSFVSASRPAPVLGLWHLLYPATYTGGRPCRIHRTPFAWCRAGCSGAVLLDTEMAAPYLDRLPGPIAPDSQAHLDEIAESLPSWQRMPEFLLPIQRAA